MEDSYSHSHFFLGEQHASAERRTWAVIWLCAATMLAEIAGGWWFGSLALVADGLHMSTHAGALLLAAIAYTYAREHAADPRFAFGTGKLGDLAGFSSAIVLAGISLLIAYEAAWRLLAPVAIRFDEAIPIAVLGLLVNVGSAWLLSRGGHPHNHGHGHAHGGHGHGGHGHGGHSHGEHSHGEHHALAGGALRLCVFEDGVPPVFRLRAVAGALPQRATIETVRPGGARQVFAMVDHGGMLESAEAIPEPHNFTAHLAWEGGSDSVKFAETEHGHAHGRLTADNNMRAALVHVLADAAVSLLVIVGLVLARTFGWLWMDPLAGLLGAVVIASWAYGLVRDTGAVLLDMSPDRTVLDAVRRAMEVDGDRLADLHVWRLGPGHLGAIVSVATGQPRPVQAYRARLAGVAALSHVTIEVQPAA